MAKKKDESNALIGVIIIALLFSVFLIRTYFTYKKYTTLYSVEDADFQIKDSFNFILFSPQIASGIVLMFWALIIGIGGLKGGGPLIMSILETIPYALIVLLAIIYLYAIAARMATTQIGVLIYKNKGICVIPTDTQNNTLIENIFHMKYIKDMLTMEEIYLNQIKKITRESGKKLFIHGEFGTRCIVWRNKQKRDECIAALETVCGRRFSSFDPGL